MTVEIMVMLSKNTKKLKFKQEVTMQVSMLILAIYVVVAMVCGQAF